MQAHLATGGGVALSGPDGIGKSALLDAVAAAAAARGEPVLRLRPAEADRRVPYAGLAGLAAQLPEPLVAALPRDRRAMLARLRRGVARAAGMRHGAAPGPRRGTPGRSALDRRLVLPELLAALTRAGPVLLVLDDVQWLDPESAELLGFAMRRRPGPRVRVLAAQRWPDPAGAHRAARLCPAPVRQLPVPPLAADDLTELLEARGLPSRTASLLHCDSGGNPALAIALAGAPAAPPWRPAPLPGPARRLLAGRLAAVPTAVTDTLTVAALATAPRVSMLVRAGREDAARQLRTAEAAGLVEVTGDAVRFTPPPLATVLADAVGPDRRAAVHAALAEAAVDPATAVRHRALRSGRPDAAAAREVAAAAAAAGGRTAAELYLLAADRAPRELAAERVAWLVAAARTAADVGAPGVAGRAAEAVLDCPDATPAHRVRARVVLIDLAGQGLADMGEMFAAALLEAGDDGGLQAEVRLRLTWAALLRGEPDAAAVEAAATARAARAAADPTTEAMALSALTQVQRTRGDARWRDTLRRSLELPAEQLPGWLHLGPRYLAARFAMVDDRLDEARDTLLALLASAERGSTGEALVDILRSLSEVATRAGRCREGLRYAHRAVAAAQQAGLSPGPSWYTAAVAELAGGSLGAAAGFARRGVRASEQEGDTIYLRRSLHALGLAQVRAGDTRAGVAALRRLRDLEAGGAADPMIVRWHGDLAGALAALGEHDEAAATLATARAAARRLGNPAGVTGYLDRATAVVLSESGQADTAVLLSTAAALHFEQLRQPIEQGHALLVQGGAERRRRRYAAARIAVGTALTIFLQADAKPWSDQAERVLARTDGAAGPGTAPASDLGLTATESRIAGLVRDGASNREIAGQLFLSVKTVEATLTRVYRKLGVRSRTQLASRLQSVDPPPPAAARIDV